MSCEYARLQADWTTKSASINHNNALSVDMMADKNVSIYSHGLHPCQDLPRMFGSVA